MLLINLETFRSIYLSQIGSVRMHQSSISMCYGYLVRSSTVIPGPIQDRLKHKTACLWLLL